MELTFAKLQSSGTKVVFGEGCMLKSLTIWSMDSRVNAVWSWQLVAVTSFKPYFLIAPYESVSIDLSPGRRSGSGEEPPSHLLQ